MLSILEQFLILEQQSSENVVLFFNKYSILKNGFKISKFSIVQIAIESREACQNIIFILKTNKMHFETLNYYLLKKRSEMLFN